MNKAYLDVIKFKIGDVITTSNTEEEEEEDDGPIGDPDDI